jgi:hypothetical protein
MGLSTAIEMSSFPAGGTENLSFIVGEKGIRCLHGRNTCKPQFLDQPVLVGLVGVDVCFFSKSFEEEQDEDVFLTLFRLKRKYARKAVYAQSKDYHCGYH